MLGKITPEHAIAFTRLSLAISLSWPLPSTATKRQVIRFMVLRFFNFVNMWLLFLPLLMTLQDWNTRPDICIKSFPLIFGSMQVLIEICLFQSQYKRFQSLIADMENDCKEAKDYEKDILQQYVDKYAMFYIVAVAIFYGTAVIPSCSPPFLGQPFPTQAKYPFDVSHQPLRMIIYIQQCYSGMQIASQLSINVLIALLLWFAAAKFDMLSNELRMVSNVQELIQCIRKHQQVLRYANEVTKTVRFLVLTTIACSAMAVLFCGLILISRQLLVAKLSFLFMGSVSLSEAFMCCWPANHLLLASSDVGLAVYESLWYLSQNVNLRKNMLFILLRCQKPVTITIACIIPILSLKYFGSYISTAFSYFTVLRIIIEDI